MRTSYSALDTFLKCPQKFKFQVLDRIPAKPSVEAAFGSSVHSALRFMFSKDPLFPTLEEILLHFSEKWQSLVFKLDLPDENIKKVYEEQGQSLIKSFFKKNPPWNFSTLDTESRFEVALPDANSGESHVLAGIIDRIDKVGEGEYEIIDYKTSRKLPSQDQVNTDLQMSLYHMALLKRWPNIDSAKVKLSLYFLKHGEKLSSGRTLKDLEKTRENVLRTIREINKKTEENNFPPNPSPLCDYCPYKAICPAWKHLYRNNFAAPPPDEKKLQESLKEYFQIKELNNQNDKRLIDLQGVIGNYMDANGLERVFDERGYYVARKLQQRFSYDFEQIKAILVSNGLDNKWQELLRADEKKLKAILKDLPRSVQEQILQQKSISKEFKVFTASTKPVKK